MLIFIEIKYRLMNDEFQRTEEYKSKSKNKNKNKNRISKKNVP